MSFFIRENEKFNRKRRPNKKEKGIRKPKISKSKKNSFQAEDDITSESDNESVIEKQMSSDLSDGETADAKRNRLAKQILENIKDKYGHEDEEISNYLKQEILERTGKAFHEVAQEYKKPQLGDIIYCKWSKLSVITTIIIHPNNKVFYSGSKDGAIIKWCLLSGKKLAIINGQWKNKNAVSHTDEILTLAITSDAKFLASAGRDLIIQIWDPLNFSHLGSLKGHKKSITGLSFRIGSHQLYSCSEDKSIKLWTVDEMAYIETLFGHEDGVLGIDSLSQERVLSCGGRDGTVRVWKIIDESHLIYHGHQGCIECVKFIDDRHFFSAADDNSLAIWTIDRKKPITTIKNAHSGIMYSLNGISEINTMTTTELTTDKDTEANLSNLDTASNLIASAISANNTSNIVADNTCKDKEIVETRLRKKSEYWISAIAALRHSDFLVSGSRDGLVKFWQIGTGFKLLKFLFSLEIKGFINALEFSSDGNFLLIGVGQEHRLGRWFNTCKTIKNSICIVPLQKMTNQRT